MTYSSDITQKRTVSLCIFCGAFKRAAWRKCSNCGVTPLGTDLVKSVYCSVGRFTSDPDRAETYQKELIEMSQTIRGGGNIDFDPIEISRLRHERDFVADIPWYAPALILFRMFLPIILFLSLMFVAIFIKRHGLPHF